MQKFKRLLWTKTQYAAPDMPEPQVADPFHQPLQVDLGIAQVSVNGRRLNVASRIVHDMPFGTLRSYSHSDLADAAGVFVVPPLSGHFPVLFRDLIIGLLQEHPVFLADWKNVRHIGVEEGAFSLQDTIDYIVRMIKDIGPDVHVVSVCQSAVPALSAVALVNQSSRELAPRSLTLMGGVIDPLANPTRVADLLRELPLEWFFTNVIQAVPPGFAGNGRLVYPAHIQLTGLMAYLRRHVSEGRELSRKLVRDDGLDPRSFPFLGLYSSLMDLAAQLFLENIETVYQERRILDGRLDCHGETVRPEAIEATALMTIEGDEDDIAAPGQTYAAHGICTHVPEWLRGHAVIRRAGHFSLFHGDLFRAEVLPEIERFFSMLSSGRPDSRRS